jgi:hypothetical protein
MPENLLLYEMHIFVKSTHILIHEVLFRMFMSIDQIECICYDSQKHS